MSISFVQRRLLAIAAILVTMLVATMPGSSAYASSGPDWFGWGVHVEFQNNTWRVLYVTYVGKNTPSPQVLASSVQDISTHCVQQGTGTLTYPTANSAYFDGKTYIRCELPALSAGLSALGYTPPSGGNPICACALGAGPFWVDAHVRQLSPAAGNMPLFDASERGVRMNLVTNSGKVRTQMMVAQNLAATPRVFTTYTSPERTIDPAGNRDVMGWHGRAVVRVADHFGWLNYLTDPAWRTFFKNDVFNNTLGVWHESPAVSGTTTITSGYELGMGGGDLYIGYSPATGKYFQGELIVGGIEPGCKGS